MFTRLAILSAWIAVFAPTAYTQSTGEITGEVGDPSGAMLAGAMVTVRNVDTNQTRATTTSTTGNYSVPYLVPGNYDVNVESPGFKNASNKGVQLQVGATVRVDFAMQVGDVTERVEVTAGASMLNSENAAIGTVIENKRIVELPLNGRNYLSLIALSPNVTTEGGPSNQGSSFQGGDRARQAFNIAGQRNQFNRYTLDGVENTDPNFNSYILKPSVDALQEFKVQSGIYSAEFGRNVSQVNGTTKSGTNQFHGVLFEFLRNSALDAKQWQQQGEKNPFRRNQFGFTLSGPVIRDKLFFLSNLEMIRDRKTTQLFAGVPTSRMLAGDLGSPQNRRIFDPFSRVFTTDAAGNRRAVSATPFPNNVIPPTRFHPLIAQKVLPLIPRATVPGDSILNNYVRQAGRPIDMEQFTQRIDWNQSDRSSWFGRYSWQNDFEGDTAVFPNAVGRVDTSAVQTVLANTRTLGTTAVNEFRFGLNIFKNDRVGYYAGKEDIGATFGIVGLPPAQTPLAWGLPSFGLANGLTSGTGSSNPFILRDTTFQFMDNVSIIRGNHSLKFGGEFRRDRFNQLGTQFTFSSFNFSGNATWDPASRNTTGHSMGDLLLGQVSAISWAYGLANVMLRSSGFTMYFQDDWKLTRNLTVNLGLRYENTRPWSDKYSGMINAQMFDPGVGPNGLLPPGQTKTPILTRAGSGDFHEGMSFHFADDVPRQRGDQYMGHSLVAPDNNDFAPRIGLAYSPGNRWTIRTGFGAFFARDIGNTVFDMGRNLGGRGNFNASSEILESPIDDPWRPLRGVSQCSGWSGLCSVQPQVFTQPYYTRSPYVFQYLFNIERQLAQNIVLEVGYQGNQGHKLQGQRYYNRAVPRTGPTDASTITQRSPWPVYAVINPYESGYNANYHGLGTKLQQRFSRGLTYLVSYTWSKSIDQNGGPRPGAGDNLLPRNMYNLRNERGLSAFDARRRFVTSLLYELPFGKGRRFGSNLGPVSWVIGGWQGSSVLTFTDGTPMGVAGIGDTMNIGQGGNGPHATGVSPFLDNPTTEKFWNIAAFDAANPNLSFQYGNSGRNVLRKPGTMQWDFSMIKTTRVTEGQTIEFRFEAFNFANHPNWLAPAADARTPTTFGVITTANTMRELQLGLKYSF